ncbi:hypothetical protein [Pseudomonas sp. Pseusp97]|uniref:hypothetical protein n=1 Tax=Pseudomonas sp. Pseusp97 TaxID=3243065 RepID=UPI0039A51D58
MPRTPHDPDRSRREPERPHPRKLPDREDQSSTPQPQFDVSRPLRRNMLHPG